MATTTALSNQCRKRNFIIEGAKATSARSGDHCHPKIFFAAYFFHQSTRDHLPQFFPARFQFLAHPPEVVSDAEHKLFDRWSMRGQSDLRSRLSVMQTAAKVSFPGSPKQQQRHAANVYEIS